MRDVLMLSGGAGSYFAGRLLKERTGVTPEMVFTDTLIEDADLYRFVLQAAANINGQSFDDIEPLRWHWENVPSLKDTEDRLAHLTLMSRLAMKLLPGFHWLIDGRTPWQVFRDVRFIGNTRAASCSHVLLQDVARAWLEANCQPASTRIHIGIHWSEIDRLNGTAKQKGAKELWQPWDCHAPLCEGKFLPANASFEEMTRNGIAIPVLYGRSAIHNNCGGFCVKAGQGAFKRLLATDAATYSFHEAEEEKMRVFLGKDVAILRDRRGGTTKPMTMKTFRERTQAGQECDTTDIGGCGCFSSPREE